MHPSSDALASISAPRRPTSTQLTTSSWAMYRRIRTPVSRSQLAKVLSAEAEKTTRESRDHCRSNTAPLWPFKTP